MLKIKNIDFNIDDKQILNNINLEFDNDKIYVITGPNGSGKSSLARVIMGIYKQTNGNIYIDDKIIDDLNINQRANIGIGYSFQRLPLFKGMTVNELLDIAIANNDVNKYEILNMVGLCPKRYLNRLIDDTLSGGELKRIELASVLAKDNKYIILDEPEAGIDLWSFDSLVKTFKNIAEKTDVTLIIITHQHKIIELGDEIILLDSGRTKKVDKGTALNSYNCLYKNDCIKELI